MTWLSMLDIATLTLKAVAVRTLVVTQKHLVGTIVVTAEELVVTEQAIVVTAERRT